LENRLNDQNNHSFFYFFGHIIAHLRAFGKGVFAAFAEIFFAARRGGDLPLTAAAVVRLASPLPSLDSPFACLFVVAAV
jgi:hypothetical protein